MIPSLGVPYKVLYIKYFRYQVIGENTILLHEILLIFFCKSYAFGACRCLSYFDHVCSNANCVQNTGVLAI